MSFENYAKAPIVPGLASGDWLLAVQASTGQVVRVPSTAVSGSGSAGSGSSSGAGGSGASGGFTGVFGLKAWYRPSDISTVTYVGTPGAESVSQVNDLSGNNFHATRSSGQPTLAANVLNNLPVLAFDGQSQALNMDGLAAAMSNTADPYHIFAVVRNTADITASSDPAFFMLHDGSASTEANAGLFALTYNPSAPRWSSYRSVNTHGVGASTADNTAAIGTWSLVEMVWSGNRNGDSIQAGVALNGGSYSYSDNGSDPSTIAYQYGRMGCKLSNGGETRFWPGEMAELAFISGAILTGTDRSSKLSYLNARYALGIAGL